MNNNTNYLSLGVIVYPPKLKMYKSLLMLTTEDKNEVSILTNDSALRLYEYYISKKSWKHFNPTDYARIGKELGWSPSKTEKCKTMLVKAGFVLIKKGSLSDGVTIYRILLGKPLVEKYHESNTFPTSEETIHYTKEKL
jgi:hypothetical protein